jgi:hypothetical protein
MVAVVQEEDETEVGSPGREGKAKFCSART